MSRKTNLSHITSANRKSDVNVGYRLGKAPTRAKLFRLAEDDSEVVFGARVSTSRSMKELAKEVVPPLKRALDRAKAKSEDVHVVVVQHDPSGFSQRAGVVEVNMSTAPDAYLGWRKRSAISTRLSTGALAERLLPEFPVPSPAQALLAQRESEARWSLLQEFGAYTSEQIADNRSRAKNRHALANRWRSEGKIFAVELRGQRLYPGFQFDPETFAPEPIVASVLATLPREEMSDWEIALWWVAGNGWLRGRRPVDVMRENPEAVSEAAAHMAEPSPL